MKTQTTPTHAIHLIFPSVRMLARINEMMAATATNTAVQVPWDETAFSPIDVLSIPEPEQNTQTVMHSLDVDEPRQSSCKGDRLTDTNSSTQEFTADTAKHQPAGIVNTINLRMSLLKPADDIVGPGADRANNTQTDNTRHQAQRVQCPGNRKDSNAKLGLHHDGHCTQPSDLGEGGCECIFGMRLGL